MSFLTNMFHNPCPLCGEKATYEVKGLENYAGLTEELAGKEEWLRVHGLSAGVPNPPDTPENRAYLTSILHPPVASNNSPRNEVHQRCKKCSSLLPPQFYDASATKDFAITVAGNVGHGKTSWLLAILSPPDFDDYELVRRSGELLTYCYDFAEPYTLEILKSGFRSTLFYQLFGTTLIFNDEVTFIRTVDIKGEMFEPGASRQPDEVIIRHLGSRNGDAWMLVIDQFGGAQSPSRTTTRPIGAKYEGIQARMIQNGTRPQKAIVWTFLDHAEWDAKAAEWLGRHVPEVAAGDLTKIGETAKQPDDTLQPYLHVVDGDAVRQLQTSIAAARDLTDPKTIDGLTALLFRLQLLYTLRARNFVDPSGTLLSKFRFLTSYGSTFVWDCQRIARQLYLRHPKSALGQQARESTDWKVFPCGRFNDRSVWADQILINAVALTDEQ